MAGSGLDDPVWMALGTVQRGLGVRTEMAARYRAEVAPFAAVRAWTAEAMRELAGLMEPGERVWVFGGDERKPPAGAGLVVTRELPGLQMVLPEGMEVGVAVDGVEAVRDAAELVALTDVAYPGFFRPRTVEMGRYWGVRDGAGRLVAMGGERMQVPGWVEVSGVCTLEEARGRGYAAGLIGHVVRRHREEGVRSLLHVSAANVGAVALYERLGFAVERRVRLMELARG